MCFSTSSAKLCPRSASFRGRKRWNSQCAKSELPWEWGRRIYPIVAIASLERGLVCGLAFFCRRKIWFLFSFGRTPRIRCVTSVMRSHIALNLLWHFCLRILPTTLIHCRTKFYPCLYLIPAEFGTLNFFTEWRRLMMSFHWLSFRQWVVMMNPGFIICNFFWKESMSAFFTGLESFCKDYLELFCVLGSIFSAPFLLVLFCSQVLWWRL
jgi:hypothetical protein